MSQLLSTRQRWGFYAMISIAVLSFVVLYLPLLSMIVQSFYRSSAWAVEGVPHVSWSWEWYHLLWQDGALGEAIVISLQVAALASLGATVLGVLSAIALNHRTTKGFAILNGLVNLPLVIPELTLGLSLLMWFTLLSLSLGMFSLVLAHITFCLSYVTIIVRTALKNIDSSWLEAARDLGANERQIFWRIQVPLLRPAILAGFLMAFMISFDDFIISFYTAGPGGDTLPLKLYAMMRFRFSPKAYALASIVLTISAVMILMIERLRRRSSRNERIIV